MWNTSKTAKHMWNIWAQHMCKTTRAVRIMGVAAAQSLSICFDITKSWLLPPTVPPVCSHNLHGMHSCSVSGCTCRNMRFAYGSLVINAWYLYVGLRARAPFLFSCAGLQTSKPTVEKKQEVNSFCTVIRVTQTGNKLEEWSCDSTSRNKPHKRCFLIQTDMKPRSP